MSVLNYLTKVKIFKRIIPSITKRILKVLNKNIFIYEFGNLKLIINLNEPMDQLIFFHNEYEKLQMDFLVQKIKEIKPHFFLDIGSNSGIYSLTVGDQFSKIKVLAFEPIKKTCSVFKKNVSLNKIKNIKLYPFGLSDKSKNLLVKAQIKNGHIQKGGFGVVKNNEDTTFLHTEYAPFKRGDDLLKIKNKIVFVKIDVEGHEKNVLEGMLKILKRNKVFLQIEIFGRNFKKTNLLLTKNNFRKVYKISSDGKVDYYYQNFENKPLTFCVSLTSIPSRFSSVNKTIDSLNNQTKKPNKIFLNIPKSYKRFPNYNSKFYKFNQKFKNVEIVTCKDNGPGTKLLGSIKKIRNYDYVILVDDDHIYKKEMLSFFYLNALKNFENCYSFCVYNIKDCKIGQGADGFMINTAFLVNINKFFNKHVKNNNKLFFNDDLWISIFLNKIAKKNIINLSFLLKKTIFQKHASIYKKHTKKNSLINYYSFNKRVAGKLRFNENVKEYLFLKKTTKIFSKKIF
tara:strand:+ start:51 stop:1583 length:1533 start_codon:yes stop_codon:yes gene_type:complete